MAVLTDGVKIAAISLCPWTESGYGPDWSKDYFGTGCLPCIEVIDVYVVQDVDYCIEMARSSDEEDGGCASEDMYCFMEIIAFPAGPVRDRVRQISELLYADAQSARSRINELLEQLERLPETEELAKLPEFPG